MAIALTVPAWPETTGPTCFPVSQWIKRTLRSWEPTAIQLPESVLTILVGSDLYA